MSEQLKDHIEEEQIERKITTAELAEAARKKESARTNPEDSQTQILSAEVGQRFRGRWDSVQTSFVDEPRKAVEQADELVAEVMQNLAQTFADEREKLESQWSS